MISSRFWTGKGLGSWLVNLRQRYVVPHIGCVLDTHPNPRLFNKWYKYPNKAHRLMRRLHTGDNRFFKKKR